MITADEIRALEACVDIADEDTEAFAQGLSLHDYAEEAETIHNKRIAVQLGREGIKHLNAALHTQALRQTGPSSVEKVYLITGAYYDWKEGINSSSNIYLDEATAWKWFAEWVYDRGSAWSEDEALDLQGHFTIGDDEDAFVLIKYDEPDSEYSLTMWALPVSE